MRYTWPLARSTKRTAFDFYFCNGFGCSTLCADALARIGTFYGEHQAAIDAKAVFTLDLDTGLDTERQYSRAKIIDMIFFQEGLSKGRRRNR